MVGRYVEADPIGIKEGRNHIYSYVGNNPIKYHDPFGLKLWCTPDPGGFSKCVEKRCNEANKACLRKEREAAVMACGIVEACNPPKNTWDTGGAISAGIACYMEHMKEAEKRCNSDGCISLCKAEYLCED